ncbi:hypothetical protein BJV78DRAFT_309952 [Lactifluus subvellereus]|nr:hypothetical protein BJV78DRAFT_309952 [Lactifluus subvellereus]
MDSDFELDDLSQKRRATSTPSDASTYPQELKESTTASWTWATSVILSAWSCALIFSPRVLLFAIGESRYLTPLETFLALHFGLLFAFSAVGLVVNIPFSAPVPERDRGPRNHPLIVSTTSFLLLSAFVSYNATGVGSLPVLYSACTGVLGVWGLWAITFAGPALVSRKTGAVKHTSAFIFGNKYSASEQKKRWKLEQKGKGL